MPVHVGQNGSGRPDQRQAAQSSAQERLMQQHDIEFISILSQEKDRAVCSVMRIGQIKIMFDCGCNERIDKQVLELVAREAQQCRFVLLSHSTCMHLGTLPYLHALEEKEASKGRLVPNSIGQPADLGDLDRRRIIATSPVAKLGAQTMHELCIQMKENPEVKRGPDGQRSGYVDFDYFTLHDVEKAFENIELVSYQEIKKLTVGDTHVILKALPSGNSVGGTAWHIEYNKLSIIYALDINDQETPISLPL